MLKNQSLFSGELVIKHISPRHCLSPPPSILLPPPPPRFLRAETESYLSLYPQHSIWTLTCSINVYRMNEIRSCNFFPDYLINKNHSKETQIEI